MAESPGSPLSSLASDDFAEEIKSEEGDPGISTIPEAAAGVVNLPSSKRQKTAAGWEQSRSSYPLKETEDISDVSSDTSGDVPGSPTASQLPDEDTVGQEQVTVCRWDGCPVGDLGNMDVLVQHIHDEHIGIRQKKYSCEWHDCIRKGMPHPSGYALRAHMRSHTREKPFYCALPECDRSFTRSDALAKHMRTVHETEALRPSDPIPKSHAHPAKRETRIKLILSRKPPDYKGNGSEATALEPGDDDTIAATSVGGISATLTPDFEPYPSELRFTEEESAMPPKELFRLLRRQVHWAEEERDELKALCEQLETEQRREWKAKEILLENVMEVELAYRVQRPDSKFDESKIEFLPDRSLPITGETPWYRKQPAQPATRSTRLDQDVGHT
ncbi:MAG: hypothetical protein M1825_003793 [Sarcosagium campestre]|nr:MAG: hypothetical protein M1825_003793 [Sarcosagium campestre]